MGSIIIEKLDFMEDEQNAKYCPCIQCGAEVYVRPNSLWEEVYCETCMLAMLRGKVDIILQYIESEAKNHGSSRHRKGLPSPAKDHRD